MRIALLVCLSSALLLPAEDRAAFLIRFGVDGAGGVNWSGKIKPAPLRLTGWQFDAGDQAAADWWKCSTRQESYWDTPYEAKMGPTARRDKVTEKGILIEVDRSRAGKIEVVTDQGSFSLDLGEALWESPRRFLDGRVEVRSAPLARISSSGTEAADYPSMCETRDGTLWLAWQSWDGRRDRILVRRRRGGNWSGPEAVTGAGGDFYRTAIAEDKNGRIRVVWAAQVNGDFDLYGSAYDGRRWSSPERLTGAKGPDMFHSLVRDRDGNLHLAWQSARSGNFDIYLRTHDGKRWSEEMQVSSDPANDWEPALAVSPEGRVTILWDTYAKGNYDVVARTLESGKLGPAIEIASSGAFESRASAQYDALGRLWIAWDEGDWNWGKDYGLLIPESGRGLLVRRQARVAVLANGKLQETGQPIGAAIPEDLRQVFHQPRIVLDDHGTPWVFFRYRVNLPQVKGEKSYRAMWRAGATSYQGGRWTPLLEFPEGFGRIDAPSAAVASRGGGIEVAWVSDGRTWPAGFPERQELLAASLPSAAASSAADLTAFRPSSENLASPHAREASDVARVRAHRVKAGSRELRIARGDIHRHTDLSWDGNRDGSLNDSYRYAMDAAGMDFQGVCDHQAGQSIPYHWWMIQKAADLFTIPGRFVGLYSYERSLSWPNGHRNVVFAERGRPVLEIPPEEARGDAGAGKLYEYLRRFGGITTSHTSATGAGTDWRDSDEQLEPVVEVYQGYRHNYEQPEAPRAPSGESARRFRAGFVSSAWAKGIKMGVQSSSDHVSTHVSYAAFYVDRLDRHAILEAARARRAFAATDNLIVDLRMGEHFMGESFRAAARQPIEAQVAGTGPIAGVALIKNNRLIYTAKGEGATMNFRYTDEDVQPGESFYYIRVEQQDGQLGWSSPIWVEYELR
jgi:hypothetical protein